MRPAWRPGRAVDLLKGGEAAVEDGEIRVEVEPWGVGVLWCQEA